MYVLLNYLSLHGKNTAKFHACILKICSQSNCMTIFFDIVVSSYVSVGGSVFYIVVSSYVSVGCSVFYIVVSSYVSVGGSVFDIVVSSYMYQLAARYLTLW